MADISALLANAADTKANFDFGNLNKSYWEGRDQYAKNDLRDAFRPTADNPNGIPMLNGQPDIGAMAKTFFQKGDFASGVSLLNQATAQQERAGYVKNGVAAPDLISPSSARQASTPDIAPRGQGGQAPPRKALDPTTIMQVAAANGIPNSELDNLSASIARQVGEGVGPNGEIDLQDPRVRGIVVPAINMAKRQGIGQVVQDQPQGQPQAVAPQPMQQPPAADFNSRFSAARPGQPDPELVRNRINATSRDPLTAKAGEAEHQAYLENQKLTNEEKLARASGQSVPAYQQGQSELATEQAGNTERAKADVVEQRAYIDNAHSARPRLQTLNTISNIISSTKNLDLGFGSETTLKIKMALEKAGLDFGDLSGAQLIQKLGAALASESTKALATRPTQFEFKTFLANNPGLSLDEKGNVRMIGIMAQNAKRDVELGVLARRNQDNWGKWDEVVEKYDREHPIKDPTTGKVLTNNSIIAPGPNAGKTPSQSAAPAKLEPGKTMFNGHLYKGGDPNVKANWELRG